jgi:hypothetical protein
MPSSAPNGSVWLDTDATSTTVFEQCWRKAVVSAGTSITGADDYALTLAYTVGFERVYLNGVLLVRAVDYTATDGSTITLTTATTVGDYVEIITTSTFVAANTYTQSAANAAFPLNTSSFFAGKNKIINADFNVNQRSFTSNSGGYGFDRFAGANGGGTATFSAETFTLGTAPVTGYEAKNFFRCVVSGQSSAGDYAIQRQLIESVRTFAGQTVTLSLWAKANTSASFAADLYQQFGSGGSPSSQVDVAGSKTAVTTSWARYSFTFNVPSIASKTIGTNNNDHLGLRIWSSAGSTYNSQTNSLGIQSITLDIWGVQLEAGSVATAFQTASGSLGGELALCQRYYTRLNSGNTGVASTFGLGYAGSATYAQIFVPLPVPMRRKGNDYLTLDYSSVRMQDYNNPYTVTALGLPNYQNGGNGQIVLVTSSGMTTYRPMELDTTNGGYIGFSAEL